jgi:hypothetical protein
VRVMFELETRSPMHVDEIRNRLGEHGYHIAAENGAAEGDNR